MHDQLLSHLQSSAGHVGCVDTFKTWVRKELRPHLPHASLICGHGRIHATGVSSDYLVLIDFPPARLNQIRTPAGGIDTPLLRRWLTTRRPIAFDPENIGGWPEISPAWHAVYLGSGLGCVMAHGVVDEENFVGSYFSFHGLPRPAGEIEMLSLRRFVPLLHRTLMRLVRSMEWKEQHYRPNWNDLTHREVEVATWVGRGKSNEEIGQLLFQSEHTVKRHVSSVLLKLGYTSRTQLAIAVTQWPLGMITKGTKVL